MSADEARTVLIVEDSEDDRVFLRAVLEHGGYAVIEATDGEAAVRTARQERPDAVIVDIQLPGIDGWETSRRIKADPLTARIPVLALSLFEIERERMKVSRCDAYMPKPVTPQQLIGAVESMLGKRSASSS